MSKETLEYLQRNVLIGFTERRGHAWHYRPELQGPEPNHYPGAIPEEDVNRRLFDWEAVERPVFVEISDGRRQVVPGYKAIVHGTTGQLFRVARSSYVMHQYDMWLTQTLKSIVNETDLRIGSAGVLGGGAQAFVMIETPEALRSASGFELLPQVLAATSHNSTLASTYKLVSTFVVCDNTLAMALAEKVPQYRTRHSVKSHFRLEEARSALRILTSGGDEMVRFVDSLADVTVTDAQWEEIVSRLVPIADDHKPNVRQKLENKRALIDTLYRSDPRCSPWRGSALGAFQAFNTHALHIAGPHRLRFDRNFSRVASTRGEREDARIVQVILETAGR
jgi:phage/plasmid-like protein (TIGR03299 family)